MWAASPAKTLTVAERLNSIESTGVDLSCLLQIRTSWHSLSRLQDIVISYFCQANGIFLFGHFGFHPAQSFVSRYFPFLSSLKRTVGEWERRRKRNYYSVFISLISESLGIRQDTIDNQLGKALDLFPADASNTFGIPSYRSLSAAAWVPWKPTGAQHAQAGDTNTGPWTLLSGHWELVNRLFLLHRVWKLSFIHPGLWPMDRATHT